MTPSEKFDGKPAWWIDAHMEHVAVIRTRLANEKARLEAAIAKRDSATTDRARAKAANEIEYRTVWVAGIERELASTLAFLGLMHDTPDDSGEMSDDELLEALFS